MVEFGRTALGLLATATILATITIQSVDTGVAGSATSLPVARGTPLTDTTLGLGTAVYGVDMVSPPFGYGVASASQATLVVWTR